MTTLIEDLLKVHRAHRVYTECNHPNKVDGEYVDMGEPEAHGGKTPVHVDDLGSTCEDGLLYVICGECCMDGGEYQREECADEHTHSLDPLDRCITARIIERHRA